MTDAELNGADIYIPVSSQCQPLICLNNCVDKVSSNFIPLRARVEFYPAIKQSWFHRKKAYIEVISRHYLVFDGTGIREPVSRMSLSQIRLFACEGQLESLGNTP